MWTYNYSSELYHTGVKGMKWGVRRAQKQLSKITGRDRNSISEEEADDFRREVKATKRGKGISLNSGVNLKTGAFEVVSITNSRNQEVGKEYAQNVLKQVKNDYYKEVAVSTAVTIGATAVLAILSNKGR